jgi:hypothetical protein
MYPKEIWRGCVDWINLSQDGPVDQFWTRLWSSGFRKMRVTELNEPGTVQSRCQCSLVEKLFVEAVVWDGECQVEFPTVLHWSLCTVSAGRQRAVVCAFGFTGTGWKIVIWFNFNRERKSQCVRGFSAAARLSGLRVRIPRVGMDVCLSWMLCVVG